MSKKELPSSDFQPVTHQLFDELLRTYPFLGDVLRPSSADDIIQFADKTQDVCPASLRYEEGKKNQPEELTVFNSATGANREVTIHSLKSLDDEREVSVKRITQASGINPDYLLVMNLAYEMGMEPDDIPTQYALYRIPAQWRGNAT
jgi:hypothetical protein